MKKTWLHTDTLLKRKVYFNVFFRLLWILFFDTIPKLDERFLKASCDIETKTVSIYFSCSYIKIHWDLTYTMNLPRYSFVALCIDGVENTGSLS